MTKVNCILCKMEDDKENLFELDRPPTRHGFFCTNCIAVLRPFVKDCWKKYLEIIKND